MMIIASRYTNVSMVVHRKSSYYLSNIISIMAGLVSLCFSAFAIEVQDLADRMSIILTLLLTAVAFKFVIADSLPKLSYSTYYIFGFIVFVFFLCVVCARLHSKVSPSTFYPLPVTSICLPLCNSPPFICLPLCILRLPSAFRYVFSTFCCTPCPLPFFHERLGVCATHTCLRSCCPRCDTKHGGATSL